MGLLRGNRAQDETVQAERGCRPPGVLRQAAAAGDTLRPLLGGLQTLLDHGSRLGEGARGCRDQRPAPREGRVGAGPPRVRSSCGGGTRTGATCPRGQGVRPGKAGLGLCEVEADFSLKVGFVWVTGGGTREGLLPSVPGRGDPGSVTQPPTSRLGPVCWALWKARRQRRARGTWRPRHRRSHTKGGRGQFYVAKGVKDRRFPAVGSVANYTSRRRSARPTSAVQVIL